MRIIRIAHNTDMKRGMYRGGFDIDEWVYDDEARHPMPENDARLAPWWKQYKHPRLMFGFKNRDQAASWIYSEEWRKVLHDAGFVVYELELYVTVNGLGTGDTQVVFDPSQIRTKTVYNLLEYLK